MQLQGAYLPSGAKAYQSPAAEEKPTVLAGPGVLFVLYIANFNAAARWAYIFDSLTPAGSSLLPPIPLQVSGAIGSSVMVEIPFALPLANGLTIASSSTGPTYTASGANDLRLTAYTKGT